MAPQLRRMSDASISEVEHLINQLQKLRTRARVIKCLRVQLSQQTVDLHVPDEITDDFDLLNSVVRKFSVRRRSRVHRFPPFLATRQIPQFVDAYS
jgi:hypothetical protein